MIDDSCQVLFDLPFCDSVAYAVPSSSQYKRNDQALKDLYDNQAKSYYLNFTRSLAQVACDTTSEAQYSLARTCTDCANDYKTWLCSVLIPRCEDWSANKDGLQPWLQPRNVNPKSTNQTLSFNGTSINSTMQQRYSYNSSRNPLIDTVIQPGPYLELKPCEDLCFDIVRSCPAQLGFSCPNSPAREMGYGRRDPADQQLWCNFPGAVVKLNNQSAAVGLRARVVSVVLSVLMVGVVVLF
jgi:calcium channel MID1